MEVDDGGSGWWLASDGNHYPPEAHPDYQITTYLAPRAPLANRRTMQPRLGSTATFKPLIYGGTCIACGVQIPKGASGWHDATIRKVSCANCPPLPQPTRHPEVVPNQLRPNPTGGTSALAIANSRKDPNWTKGAAGEYLMSKALHEKVPAGRIILDDRAIPHSTANIDHVVIAPTGVWIIDSKHWKGLIQVKSAGGFLGAKQKLLIDGRDRSPLTEKIYSQVIPIANILGDHSIPIHPALVFVDGDWSGVTLRVVQNRPYEMLGVMISWPKAIIAKISEPGPIPAQDVVGIAALLDRELHPAT